MQPSKDRPLSASMNQYEKGGVDIVDPAETLKRYVYSNVYEIGAKARPYEKIAVAKNGGRLLVDLEDRTEELRPGEGIMVPHEVRHRTRAPEKTVMLMFEGAGIQPTGD